MNPSNATLPRFTGGESGDGRPWSWSKGWVVAGAALVAAGVVAARCLGRVVVEGNSMAPTLLDGDRLVVLVRPWGRHAVPTVGDVVAVPDPRQPDRLLVKRVATVDREAGTAEVSGDAPDASTDSRAFGPVPLASVVGRVVHRYGPPGRSGPLPRPTEYHQN